MARRAPLPAPQAKSRSLTARASPRRRWSGKVRDAGDVEPVVLQPRVPGRGGLAVDAREREAPRRGCPSRAPSGRPGPARRGQWRSTAWKTRSHSSSSAGCERDLVAAARRSGLRQRLGHHHDGLGVDDVAALAQQGSKAGGESGVSRKPGRSPRLRYSCSARAIRPSRIAAAAVDARRVGAPREAVGEAQHGAVELEALARRPGALADVLECGDLGHPAQDTPARMPAMTGLTRSQLLVGAAAVALPRASADAGSAGGAGGGDARPGSAAGQRRPTRASARLQRPLRRRAPAAIAQPLDAGDLAAAPEGRARARTPVPRARGRPQLHRRLDRRGRRRARPAAPARHQAARRRQRAGGRGPTPDRADRGARAPRAAVVHGSCPTVGVGRLHARRRLRLRRPPLRPGLRHAASRRTSSTCARSSRRSPTPTCCTACAEPARAWRPSRRSSCSTHPVGNVTTFFASYPWSRAAEIVRAFTARCASAPGAARRHLLGLDGIRHSADRSRCSGSTSAPGPRPAGRSRRCSSRRDAHAEHAHLPPGAADLRRLPRQDAGAVQAPERGRDARPRHLRRGLGLHRPRARHGRGAQARRRRSSPGRPRRLRACCCSTPRAARSTTRRPRQTSFIHRHMRSSVQILSYGTSLAAIAGAQRLRRHAHEPRWRRWATARPTRTTPTRT